MQSENRILRLPYSKLRLAKDGAEFVPGTKFRRLPPIPLGPRAVGILNDEINAPIEGLRRVRDGEAAYEATRVVEPTRRSAVSP